MPPREERGEAGGWKRPIKNAPLAGRWERGACQRHQARSKRSRFITLVQAATKSFTNFSLASALA